MTTTGASTSGADDSTLGLWRLDEPEGSAEVADSSGNDHLGVVGNVTMGVAGRIGKAALFSGESGSEIQIADDKKLEFHAHDFTVEAWVYPASIDGARTVVSHWGDEPCKGKPEKDEPEKDKPKDDCKHKPKDACEHKGKHDKGKHEKGKGKDKKKDKDECKGKHKDDCKHKDKGHQHSWRLMVVDGALEFEWRVGAKEKSVAGGAVEIDAWTHVAVVRRKHEIVLMIDGEVVATEKIKGGFFRGQLPMAVKQTYASSMESSRLSEACLAPGRAGLP
jgi:hypothetical protein